MNVFNNVVELPEAPPAPTPQPDVLVVVPPWWWIYGGNYY
jgi:hypothetical protein